jgi:D-proline reductase (dithiol) PrdB
VYEALRALYQIKVPGTIVDLPFRWRREKYGDYQPPTAAELE